MRIAIHSQQEQPHYHLPHQGVWFAVMLLLLLMLFGKVVGGATALFA